MKNDSNINIGNYIDIYEARTNIEDLITYRGGGDVITSILVYGIKTGLLKNALVVKMSDTEPWKAIPILAETTNEVRNAAGSKYTFVSYNEYKNILEESTAIVGLPCQINPKLSSLKIGLFCGIIYNNKGFDYFLKKNNIKKENIASLDYRKPFTKKLYITFKNGDAVEYLYPWWLGYFFHDRKCLLCRNFTNHYADISVGDRRPGHSVVIVRTNRGKEIFEKAIHDGYIIAEKISFQDFLLLRGSALIQKEVKGGFINNRLVSICGNWCSLVPLSILRKTGKFISKKIR
jgi:coenzyme F420 hydrogenase subunit beta